MPPKGPISNMQEWLRAVEAAWPVVITLGLMIWALIVFHGDTRWLKRSEAVGSDGKPVWAGKEEVAILDKLVMGQNDTIADHEHRLSSHESRDETVLAQIDRNLESLNEVMKLVSEKVIRLEERSLDRRRTD